MASLNRLTAITLVVTLAGCAVPPARWERESWANESLSQAKAECYNFINSAQGRGSDLYLCMKAKSWNEIGGY